MDTGVIVALVAAAAAIVSSVLTQIFLRGTRRADIHTTIAAGAGVAVDTIKDVLEEVRAELEEARQEVESTRKEIKELRAENEELRNSIALLNLRISELHHLNGAA